MQEVSNGMKKNEIAFLILVIAVSVGIAYAVGQSIFGNATTKPVDVETATEISSQIETPSDQIFNDNAINPTVPVKIGDPSNQQPFGN